MGCYSHKIWSQIIKGTGAELRRLDKRSRKLLTMNDELHPKSGVDRHYVYKNTNRYSQVLNSWDMKTVSKVRKIILDGV